MQNINGTIILTDEDLNNNIRVLKTLKKEYEVGLFDFDLQMVDINQAQSIIYIGRDGNPVLFKLKNRSIFFNSGIAKFYKKNQ